MRVLSDLELELQTPREIVVSLSLQSISSLASIHGIREPQEAAEKLASFFISIGCDKVYDLNIARHLALVETHREYRQKKRDNVIGPILSSVCPGWICYVEKTNGDLVIPQLSKVRSPQQIMGALIKRSLEANRSKRKNIFHVTVMPCFDKKLEASRRDFISEEDGCKDVDCVLTPIELEEILKREDVSLSLFERRPLDLLIDCEIGTPLTSHHGSSSGGYADNLFLNEVRSVLDCRIEEILDNVEYVISRNNDFIELSLKNLQSKVESSQLPRIAIINGFRNIQTVMQRLKRKMITYDYLEVMACPSGCINGGAQSKPSSLDDQQAWIQRVKDVYRKVAPTNLSTSCSDTGNSLLYERLGIDEMIRHELLYTNFHSVPKSSSLEVSW